MKLLKEDVFVPCLLRVLVLVFNFELEFEGVERDGCKTQVKNEGVLFGGDPEEVVVERVSVNVGLSNFGIAEDFNRYTVTQFVLTVLFLCHSFIQNEIETLIICKCHIN